MEDFEKILEKEAAKEKALTNKRPPRLSVFDTRPILADLAQMERSCNELVNQANAMQILSAGEKNEAVTLSGQLQTLYKDVEKKCVDYVTPYRKVINAVNGPKKRIMEAAKKAKSIINQKVFQYKKQEEIDQAKQQKLIDEASEKLQKKLKKQADEIGIEAPKVTPIKAPKQKGPIRGDNGATLYTRKAWKCEIINEKDVPREYCIPSQKLLNRAVKMGKREIPGCKIYEDETPVTRAG